jgi:sugar phosphate isomerase/epimerase
MEITTLEKRSISRKNFLFHASGLMLAVYTGPGLWSALSKDKMDRIALGTVTFRYRFKQTKPRELETIKNELTLLDVPAYYRDRFKINRLEFWSNHFESLEPSYILQLKEKVKKAKCRLINVQIDSSYNLASSNEEERQKSLKLVKEWIDAVALLGSECIRINPGRPNGSVDKSIASMKELYPYVKSKKLILLTENHFGIETNPDIQLRINKETGPDVYTLPDFGNYPLETMFESLAKVLPHAYLVSAKAVSFDNNYEHTSYDFDKCVKMAEKAGFKGVYSVEQWAPGFQDINYEKVADWMIGHVKNNI